MKRLFLLLFVLILSFVNAAEYIDYQIRTDDFYADVTGEFGNENIVWKIKYKMSSSSSTGSYSSLKTYTDTEEYSGGRWDYRNTSTIWTGKCLDNADNLYVFIEAWEDDNSNTTFGTGDDDYRSDTDYDLNIGGNSRNSWVNFNSNDNTGDYVNCGSVDATNGDYRVELDVWWNWSLPVNPSFSKTNIAANSFTLNKTNNNSYRITNWDYQVSTNTSFSTIVQSGTTITNESTSITGLNPNTTYYVRIRGNNETGSGNYSSYQSFTTIGELASTTNVFPEDAETDMPRRVTVSWRYSGSETPTGFKVYQKTDAGEYSQVSGDVLYTTDKLYHKRLNQANWGEQITWKIVAYYPTEESQNFSERNFTIMSDPGEQNQEQEPEEVVYNELEEVTVINPPILTMPTIDFGEGEVAPTIDLEFNSAPANITIPVRVQDQPDNPIPNPSHCGASLNITLPNNNQTQIVFDFSRDITPTELVHWNGSSWVNITSSANAIFGLGSVTFNWTSSSRGDEEFAVNSGGESTLPVELSSFTADIISYDNVELNWVTQSEMNVSGFYLYRSEDENVENSLKLNQTIISATNTSSVEEYSFVDDEVNPEGRKFYWLESVDLDGTTELFGPIIASFENEMLEVQAYEINAKNFENVQLEWKVTNLDENLRYFEVFRNTTLDFTNAEKLNSENIYIESANDDRFTFVDENAEIGENYFYWISANSWDEMVYLFDAKNIHLNHTEFSDANSTFVDGSVLLNWNSYFEAEMKEFIVLKSENNNLESAIEIERISANNNPSNYEISYDMNQGEKAIFWIVGETESGDKYYGNPREFEAPFVSYLKGNYPNPFKPSGAGRSPGTTIKFSVENPKNAKLGIYNLKGQIVKSFDIREKGDQEIKWLGLDNSNNSVASGVYFYRLISNGKVVSSKKMLLLK